MEYPVKNRSPPKAGTSSEWVFLECTFSNFPKSDFQNLPGSPKSRQLSFSIFQNLRMTFSEQPFSEYPYMGILVTFYWGYLLNPITKIAPRRRREPDLSCCSWILESCLHSPFSFPTFSQS